MPEKDMDEPSRSWYALFVRSRHEFVTSEQLQKRGVEVFLPVINKTRRWSDRNKSVLFPLFPGYIFVHVRPSAEIFLNIIRAHGTVSFVTQEPGRPAQVDPQEIRSLQLMLEGGSNIDIYPHLCEGKRVYVKQGPLKGAEGILAKKNDQSMFLVNINILGRSIGMRISADDLDQK
jgi:transcription antitermination factor NusG